MTLAWEIQWINEMTENNRSQPNGVEWCLSVYPIYQCWLEPMQIRKESTFHTFRKLAS